MNGGANGAPSSGTSAMPARQAAASPGTQSAKSPPSASAPFRTQTASGNKRIKSPRHAPNYGISDAMHSSSRRSRRCKPRHRNLPARRSRAVLSVSISGHTQHRPAPKRLCDRRLPANHLCRAVPRLEGSQATTLRRLRLLSNREGASSQFIRNFRRIDRRILDRQPPTTCRPFNPVRQSTRQRPKHSFG